MGRANRRIVEQRYDVGVHVERLLEVYREAVNSFEPRSLDLPAQEVEVALMALRAQLAEKEALLRAIGGGKPEAS